MSTGEFTTREINVLKGVWFVMSVHLQNMSWQELAEQKEKAKGVAIIPIGSTEQHGYHLPLGTDTIVAITLAEDVAQRTGAVVTPPVWYGWSPHHMVLPGTITVRPEILIELLYDVFLSLKEHGFTKFIAINGHRIVNISWMQIAAERAQRNLGIKVMIADPAFLSKDLIKTLGYGPVGHAEEIETSHILYRHPELDHLEKAKDNPIEPNELYSVDPSFMHDTMCYVPSTLKHMQASVDKAGGTTGSPTKSDKEKGKIYHEHIVNNLVTVVKNLQKV